jgi:hemoglobin
MPKHIALPGLNAGLFRHWLTLFHATVDGLPNQALRERVRSNQTVGT